jgi:gamma-glutamyl-gamma-aminobutyrate hydrolase PuuD
MRRPLIGITTYHRTPHADADIGLAFATPCDYVDSVRRAGGVPVLLSPGESAIDEILSAINGLMVIGGGDVEPACYVSPGHPQIGGVDRERDEFEFALVRAAVERGVPFFGICRGAQVANVALGGSLIEHVPDAGDGSVPHATADGGFIDHAVMIASGSKLAAILGVATCAAPSSHHQAIRDVAPGLTVTAHAADGIIEAVELFRHRWFVAVQWHPERSAARDPLQQRLFDAFVMTSTGGLHGARS